MIRLPLPSAAELALTCSSLCDSDATEAAYPRLTLAWSPGALEFAPEHASEIAHELVKLARVEAAHEALCVRNVDRSGARAHARARGLLGELADKVRRKARL